MNMFNRTTELINLLQGVSSELDIPESKYEEAKKRYEGIGQWLCEDPTLAKFKPQIYPQGSFRLGTVIKPITNEDEYDIDLVCYLDELNEKETTQEELKQMVGDRLKAHKIYNDLLDEEGRRCWTLVYANEFHMDILPSIADEQLNQLGGVHVDAILITDKKKIEKNDPIWPKSNPRGYADWFDSRQKVIFMSMKEQLAKALNKDIDEVPDYKVKTPLQRAVQILKRHRDMYFSKQKDSKCKPISIIITTLAGKFYNGQDNVFGAIHDILNSINEDVLKKDGKFYIPNPANFEENFADKWNEDQKLPVAFISWITAAREDFCNKYLLEGAVENLNKSLEKSLGISLVGSTAEKGKQSISPSRVTIKTTPKTRPWVDR